MNGFLLDTNILSELIKPKPEPRVLHWIAATDENLLFLSILKRFRWGLPAASPYFFAAVSTRAWARCRALSARAVSKSASG